MKKLVLAGVVSLLIIISSCKKNNSTTNNTCPYTLSTIIAPVAEQQALQDSLTAHGIQATKDSSGFFYTINQPGTDPKATGPCSNIATYYRGGFFNGTGFDSTVSGNPAIFPLGGVIPGWQKGIPLVGTGGSINLYIPPSLAYGAEDTKYPQTGQVIIPANSYLVFQVQVVGLSN